MNFLDNLVKETRADEAKSGQDAPRSKLKKPCAWLKSSHKTYPMNYEAIRIGSESGKCDIVLGSRSVGISRVHAIITRQMDDTFTIDNNSKNGTFVNNDEIDVKYPLQHGDVIRLGQTKLKLTFLLHKDEEDERKTLERMLMTLLVSIIVMLLVFKAIEFTRFSPEKYFRNALIELNNGQYDLARQDLESAKAGTDDKELLHDIGQKLNLIEKIETTRNKWEVFQRRLVEENDDKVFQEVTGFLSVMEKEAVYWSWLEPDEANEGKPINRGKQEKEKAVVVKRLLDASSSAKAVLRLDFDIRKIDTCIEDITTAKALAGRYAHVPYIQRLSDLLEPTLLELKNAKADHEGIMRILETLDVAQHNAHDWIQNARKQEYEASKRRVFYKKILTDHPDYGDIKAKLTDYGKRHFVRKHVTVLLPAIESLEEQTVLAKTLEDKASDCKFEEIQSFRLKFNPQAEWGRISELKLALECYVKDCIQNDAEAVSFIFDRLEAMRSGHLAGYLAELETKSTMDAVFACDCFKKPLPSRSRMKPSGKYDEILGIEFFYSYLNSLEMDKPQARPYWGNMSFRPLIDACYYDLTKVESDLRYLETSFGDLTWINKGRILETRKECHKLLEKRKDIIDGMTSRQDSPDSRDYLLSRGIALYLSSDSDNKADTLKKEVIVRFRAYKAMLSTMLDEQYERVSFENRIRNRKTILKAGIPGNGTIKELWLEEFETHSMQQGQN